MSLIRLTIEIKLTRTFQPIRWVEKLQLPYSGFDKHSLEIFIASFGISYRALLLSSSLPVPLCSIEDESTREYWESFNTLERIIGTKSTVKIPPVLWRVTKSSVFHPTSGGVSPGLDQLDLGQSGHFGSTPPVWTLFQMGHNSSGYAESVTLTLQSGGPKTKVPWCDVFHFLLHYRG